MNFRFESPEFLYLIPCVLIFYFGMNALNKRKIAELKKKFGDRLYPFLTSSLAVKKRRQKQILQVLAMSFLSLAMARPQFGESMQEIKSMGVELIIAFDVSKSMLAEDVQPNRMTFAKSEIGRLLSQLPGSKVGLVAFAGSAALISPITTDHSSIRLFLESVNQDTISTQGTEFKRALEESKAAFERGGQGEDPQVKVTRVILVVSDGEDQEAGALDFANELSKQGVKIFGVAVGTESGGSIPERDPSGYLKGYKKDAKGQVIVTKLNGNSLKELAQAGKGSFYVAAFGSPYLTSLVQDIDQLEKTQFDTELNVQYEERYQFFLLLALIFAVLDQLISERRGEFKFWRGRFEVPPA